MNIYESELKQSGGGGDVTKEYVDTQLATKLDIPILMQQTLSAGSTTVTFTGVPTTGINIIDVYTSMAGLDYVSIADNGAGTIAVTYEAQSSSVSVFLKIEVYS